MNFTIVKTKTTPQAEFNKGHLQISGKSVPFNSPDFYDTIGDRLRLYMENPEKITKIDFQLSAVNAVSKRCIMSTFRIFEEMNNHGCQVAINWFYQEDDEDIFELGEICKSSFNLSIAIKEQNNL